MRFYDDTIVYVTTDFRSVNPGFALKRLLDALTQGGATNTLYIEYSPPLPHRSSQPITSDSEGTHDDLRKP